MNTLDQYNHFPSSRYMGSKNKIIKELYKVFKKHNFKTALDLFSGSSSVSYLLKAMGKKVISNDYMQFAANISTAIILNNKTKLNQKDLEILTRKPKKYDKFVQTKFDGIFFSKEDNDFIDIIRHNSLQLTKIKRSLALAAIIKACQKKQPRGLFTFKGFRYDDGRLDLKKSIQEQFFDAVKVFNKSIFNNKQNNIVLNKNFLDVNNQADLIYIDPPYYSKHSDNGYVRRYHFLEGIIRSWKGVEIQENSIVKKFKNYPSMFDTEVGSKFAIELLIKKYANKIIIFSYSSNSLPDIDFFKKIGKKNNMKTSVKKINYTYSFGTQKTNASMKNKVEEFIITMIQNG